MKVSRVNYSYHQQKVRKSFKGLWGDSVVRREKRESDGAINVFDVVVKKYYPFGDESHQAVNDVMKSNVKYISSIENNLVKYTGIDVSVREGLLFSAKQWFKYISNKLSLESHECKLIEQNLKKLHLEKYLRA